MILRQIFQPSLWWVFVAGVWLLALGYTMPDEPVGFDWGLLMRVGGYVVAVVAVLKLVHSFYFSNRRYDFKFGDIKRGWQRSITIPRNTNTIEIKVSLKRAERLTTFRVSPQKKPIWNVIGHSNDRSGKFIINGVVCSIQGYSGQSTDKCDSSDRVRLFGRWVSLNPPYDAKVGDTITLTCSITATRRWRGEIGFLSKPEGRRTAHGKIKVR